MKISTPTIRIPSFTFRLDVLIGVLVLYLLIVCLVFGSCLKISFTEGMVEYNKSGQDNKKDEPLEREGYEITGDTRIYWGEYGETIRLEDSPLWGTVKPFI